MGLVLQEAIFTELEDAFDPNRVRSRTSRGRGYQDWRRGGRDSGSDGGGKRQEGPAEQSRRGDMRVSVDTAETDEAYTFLADLPGTKKDNVKVPLSPSPQASRRTPAPINMIGSVLWRDTYVNCMQRRRRFLPHLVCLRQRSIMDTSASKLQSPASIC